MRTEPRPSSARGVPTRSANRNGIEFLEKKLQRKDEVIAELMEEHVSLKKSLGGAAMLAGIPTGESPGVELTQLPT